jgi:2-(1,2-epoxy-1,2-dihydrophenyl)acetyl-CoA isomerase
LSFNRPARRNSLTDPIVYALTDTMDAAASDESVRVIHLQGEGDHFCSGFDLAERTPGPDRPRVGSVHRRMNGHVNRLIPAMLTCQTPIVCTARGWVIGLGLDILLASDFAVVADDARLWAPFTTFGFTPDSGATWLIPVWPAWPARARCSCWARRSQEPTQPPGTWSTALCPPPTSRPSPRTGRPPGCRTYRRRWSHQVVAAPGSHRDLTSHLADEAWAMEVSSRSDDFKEYGQASKEKREPRFTGQ